MDQQNELWTVVDVSRLVGDFGPDGVRLAIERGDLASVARTKRGRRLGVSRDYLYRQARAGRLPFARRIGQRIVFDEAGLERWNRQRKMG